MSAIGNSTAIPPPSKPSTSLTPAVAKPAQVVVSGGSGLALGVNKAIAAVTKPPKTLRLGNTAELKDQAFMHALIYSETSARKTTTAAEFAGPQKTRIISTRRKEQLIPLQNQGYQYAEVQDDAALLYALQFPERLWPDWAE